MGFARIWDARTGHPLTDKLHHEALVASVEFSPDGRKLLTASWDSKARLWDAVTGNLVTMATGGTNGLWDARFSPDGTRFATAGKDEGVVRVWETATGLALEESLPVPRRCRVTWMGNDVLVAGGGLIGGGNGTLLVRFSVGRPPTPVPPWLPPLAEALSGITTNRSPAPELLQLRTHILGMRSTDFWSEWGRKLFH